VAGINSLQTKNMIYRMEAKRDLATGSNYLTID